MKANRSQPEVITRNGKAVSVIVPIAEYEELLERVEDGGGLEMAQTRASR
jgi:prevent-host-death family protein